MKEKFMTMLVWAGLIVVLLGAPASATQGPIETIKPVLDNLTQLLNSPALQGDAHRDERRQKIMSTIKEGFDFQEMSKRVLGMTWKDVSQADREHFTLLMTKLLENSYIGRLEDYHYKRIDYIEVRVEGGQAQVSTVVEKDNVKLPVCYILQLTPKGWMVYDINIEGVSLIRNYMEQFRSILHNETFQGLVKIIEEKNRSFENNAKGS